MEMITNEKINFNSLEEKTYKKMMELGRNIIRDKLRLVDDLTHTAVRNIVIGLGKKKKELEEEKIELYEKGELEGNKEAKYVYCEHDGIYVKRQKSKKRKKI